MALPRTPRTRTAGARQTEPAWNPFTGGLGVIPRRGELRPIQTRERLEREARHSPLHLLRRLIDWHPAVGLAVWNVLRLACPPGDLRFIARDRNGGPASMDEQGTAAIDALWSSLPSEIGGLDGLLTQMIQEVLLTGLVCAEAVPAGRLKGVGQVWPVSSLTIWFKRLDDTGRLTPFQRQIAGGKGGLQELGLDTFFWRTIDAMVDQPYGRAPYATAVTECLFDVAMMQDLRDAVHNGAWPRLAHSFDFARMYELAHEMFGLNNEDANEWVQARFQEAVDTTASLKADDNIHYDSAGDVKVLEAGQAFRALEPILMMLRQRVTQSLKSLPTLMGINDGSTQTYTTVEWKIYAAGLESVRQKAIDVLVQVADLHLRLLGMPLKAHAMVKPIQSSDALVDAQAESLRIDNEVKKVERGWITEEEASIVITGSGPISEPKPAKDPSRDPLPTGGSCD